MPSDEIAAARDEDDAGEAPPAVRRKTLLSRLHMPVGKAIALAAMPSAALMGMGFTSPLAKADPQPANPFRDGPCVEIPDEGLPEEYAELYEISEGVETNEGAADAEAPEGDAGEGAEDAEAARQDARDRDAQETRQADGDGRPGAAGGSRQSAPEAGAEGGSARSTGPDEQPDEREDQQEAPGAPQDGEEAQDGGEEGAGESGRSGGLLGGLLGDVLGGLGHLLDPRSWQGEEESGTAADEAATQAAEEAARLAQQDPDGGAGQQGDAESDRGAGEADGAAAGQAQDGTANEDAGDAPDEGNGTEDGTGDSGAGNADGNPDENPDENPDGNTDADAPGDAGRDAATDGADEGREEPAGEDSWAPDEQGRLPYPCPVELRVDGTGEQTPLTLPNEPWYLEASSLLLRGLHYHGVVNVVTADGSVKQVLKFTAEKVDIGDLHQIVDGEDGVRYHVATDPGSVSTFRNGTVTMYTERLEGKLFGLIPIVFDPEHQPPIDLPIAYFTDVFVAQAGQFGGDLTLQGMRLYTAEDGPTRISD